jgi:hypothetical protein
MKKILLLCCSAAILFTLSCSKKEERVTMRTEMLTKGQWQITSLVSEYRINGQTTTMDLYAAIPDCEKDNLFTFNLDGTATTDEGPTKCDPNGPQTYVNVGSRWKLITADTELKVSDTSKTVISTIVSLTKEGMVLQYEKNENDIPTTVTTEYRHIQ